MQRQQEHYGHQLQQLEANITTAGMPTTTVGMPTKAGTPATAGTPETAGMLAISRTSATAKHQLKRVEFAELKRK